MPRERLLALLDEFALAPGEVERSGDAEWTARLAAYRRARDHFLRAGRHVQPSIDVRRMLAQVREPLLQALRISPDFQPAYDPLLQMAVAIGRNDPATARALLSDLVRLQPARSDAREELARIDEARP